MHTSWYCCVCVLSVTRPGSHPISDTWMGLLHNSLGWKARQPTLLSSASDIVWNNTWICRSRNSRHTRNHMFLNLMLDLLKVLCVCVCARTRARAHACTHEQAGTRAHLISRKAFSRHPWFSSVMGELFISYKTVCNAGKVEKLSGLCSFWGRTFKWRMVSLCVHRTPWWRASIFYLYANALPFSDFYFPLKMFMEGEIKYFNCSRFISHDHGNKL